MSARKANITILEARGFRVSQSLPESRDDRPTQLRPLEEIAGRGLVLRAVCLWVAGDEGSAPASQIFASLQSNQLHRYVTASEQATLDQPREQAHDEHLNTIGWRLENLWPLAWILGFDPAPALAGMADDSVIGRLLSYFAKFELSSSFLTQSHPRDATEVEALEDLFYCAHNAVRSAQLGGDTVPEDFDPIADGGVIHERRHALTWAISPGVSWDDVDLST